MPHHVITDSVLRPKEFRAMPDDIRELWKMIVYGAMTDGGKDREQAEKVAWADTDRIKRERKKR